ncbi:MAG: DUF969 family protein [Acidobacteria bacterium]|nr:DUF969 family protein [Acidobacteriota bacterium]MCW5968468.1 DUF969 family protein [Blastocatellales bacterium]
MTLQDWLKLGGIAIVVVGLALRLRTTIVVVAAAFATGLAAGLPLFSGDGRTGLIDMLGKAFADNRLVTLFIITLPAIGLAEKHGLQIRAGEFIRKLRAATAGRLQITYQLFRIVHGVIGIRLNGHPSFVRPLVYPMSIGAAAKQMRAKNPESLPSEVSESIKAAAAAGENYGNFYGQNLSPVQAGVLLVYGTMLGLGVEIRLWDLVIYTTPIVAFSVLIAAVQFLRLDRRIRSRCAKS